MTKIYIGENTVLKGDITVGSDCSFWHNAVIRADSGYIHIGNSVNIQDLVMIHTGFNGYNVTIGNNVTIGHSAIIHGCTIKDESLIGMGAIIMNGAEIGFHCIVGAGALVTENKKFEDGSLIIGSPAKAVRKLTDKEIEGIHQNALLYVKEAQKELNPADF
ncbi:MAG: gamma carbonic anhydrase family protein [Erysipelotrichaceae bacterium]|nr:gamma carbonic anhydrase family protein [Erysipelotrichaceae bacterium]